MCVSTGGWRGVIPALLPPLTSLLRSADGPSPTISGSVAAAPPREASAHLGGSPPSLSPCLPRFLPSFSGVDPYRLFLPPPPIIRITSAHGRREGRLREVRQRFTFIRFRGGFASLASLASLSPDGGLRLGKYRAGCFCFFSPVRLPSSIARTPQILGVDKT